MPAMHDVVSAKLLCHIVITDMQTKRWHNYSADRSMHPTFTKSRYTEKSLFKASQKQPSAVMKQFS